VEIRQQALHHAELETRGDEKVGLALESAGERSRFQRP
jgi:hypothetical protein